MIDKIFKIGILILVAIFLFVYYLNGQNGRYKVIDKEQSISVFDRQKGIAYIVTTRDGRIGWGALDLVNGRKWGLDDSPRENINGGQTPPRKFIDDWDPSRKN